MRRVLLAVILLAAVRAFAAPASVCTGMTPGTTELTFPSSPIPAGVEFSIAFRQLNMFTSDYFVDADVVGNTIVVSQDHYDIGTAADSCQRSSVYVEPLSAGTYTVIWRAKPRSGPYTESFRQTVVVQNLPVAFLRPFFRQALANGVSTLTASLNAARASNTVVSLSSSNVAVATVPPTVTIPAGQTEATFSFNSHGVGLATITAALDPALTTFTTTAQVKVIGFLPCAGLSFDQKRVTVSPTPTPAGVPVSILYEKATFQNTLGTFVTRSGNAITFSIRFLFAAVGCVYVEGDLGVLPAGTYQVFERSTLGLNSPLSDPVLISTFTVTALVPTFLQPTLNLRTGMPGSLTLQIPTAIGTDTVIDVVSSSPAVAAVPTTVTIPANQTSVTFNVVGVAPGNATITATLPSSLGGGSATAAIAVADPSPDVPALSTLALAVLAAALAAVAALYVK